MDDQYLYRQISEKIRQDILDGRFQPGERLPSIRKLMLEWNCTPGTIQHAYQDLAQQGLIISQVGKGTHVSSQINQNRIHSQAPLRRANMVHRAEAFLLESLTAGYELEEIQQSIQLAMDHWRSLQEDTPSLPDKKTVRFSGSHDMAVIWIAGHIQEIVPDIIFQTHFTGSLGGLMALAEGRADIVGCHLWDIESNTYNTPYIRKIFPGKKIAQIRLAYRRMGLIVPPGNPFNIHRLEDLTQPAIRFVNRQTGSGTRVWLDAQLKQIKLEPDQIAGYEDEKLTHSAVARSIAENTANAGLGLESAAASFQLDFIPLVEECYDLVTYASFASQEPILSIVNWLNSEAGNTAIAALKGYRIPGPGNRQVQIL